MLSAEHAEASGCYRDWRSTVEPAEQGIRSTINHLYYDLHACHVGHMILATEAAETAFRNSNQYILDHITQHGCPAEWGVCPDHGATLASTANRSRCTHPHCGRTWDYDRIDTYCGEPCTITVTPDDAPGFDLCHGHAIDARARLDAPTTPYDPENRTH